MKKKTLIAMAAIAGLGLAALFMLQSYKLDLIHTVVVHALIQKAPPGFPEERIRATFDTALRQASQSGLEAEYLNELLELSRRLEKIQHLSENELEQILTRFLHSEPPAIRSEGLFERMLTLGREMPSLPRRDGSRTLSELRPYDQIGFCEGASSRSSFHESAAREHSILGVDFGTAGPAHFGRLEEGAQAKTPKARPEEGRGPRAP